MFIRLTVARLCHLILGSMTRNPTPPPLTTALTKKAIFENIFGAEDNNILLKTLDSNGYKSVHDMIGLDKNDIGALVFNNGNQSSLLDQDAPSLEFPSADPAWDTQSQLDGYKYAWDDFWISDYRPVGINANPPTTAPTVPFLSVPRLIFKRKSRRTRAIIRRSRMRNNGMSGKAWPLLQFMSMDVRT